MLIRELLREKRLLKNITITSMAEFLGKHKGNIHEIESGKRPLLKKELMKKWFQILDISLDLLSIAEKERKWKKTGIDFEIKEILYKFSMCYTNDFKQNILNLIQNSINNKNIIEPKLLKAKEDLLTEKEIPKLQEQKEELLTKAKMLWSSNYHLMKLIEECGELIQVASKIVNNHNENSLKEDLVNELVDVQLYIDQIIIDFNLKEEIEKELKEKLRRTKKCIKLKIKDIENESN